MPRTSTTWRPGEGGGVRSTSWKPGQSGRPRGTVNKRTQYAREILEQHGVDPVEQLCNVIKNEAVSLDIRVDCMKTLMPYVYPRLAAVEVSGGQDPVRVEHDHEHRLLMQRAMSNARLRDLVENVQIETADMLLTEEPSAVVVRRLMSEDAR